MDNVSHRLKGLKGDERKVGKYWRREGKWGEGDGRNMEKEET